MPEPIRLDLFEAGTITPGFSTYVPVGLEPETRTTTVGRGVDFTANFAGVREPRARMGYFVYDEGMSRAQVNEQILTFTSGRRPRAQPESGDRFAWSLLEQRYEYDDDDGRLILGTIALGQRAGRYFHILIQYPAEYGDGMGPRIARIIDHWRWADDGSLLVD